MHTKRVFFPKLEHFFCKIRALFFYFHKRAGETPPPPLVARLNTELIVELSGKQENGKGCEKNIHVNGKDIHVKGKDIHVKGKDIHVNGISSAQ